MTASCATRHPAKADNSNSLTLTQPVGQCHVEKQSARYLTLLSAALRAASNEPTVALAFLLGTMWSPCGVCLKTGPLKIYKFFSRGVPLKVAQKGGLSLSGDTSEYCMLSYEQLRNLGLKPVDISRRVPGKGGGFLRLLTFRVGLSTFGKTM